MSRAVRLAVVGERSEAVRAHLAIPEAIRLVRGPVTEVHWFPTERLTGDALAASGIDAVWVVPGSPYRDTAGALAAIRWARERGVAFLGTCGGCQHAVIEFFRNVLGEPGAEHAETAPDAEFAVIAPLACALVGVRGRIRFDADSRLARSAGSMEVEEGYHCRFGLSAEAARRLEGTALRIVGRDLEGDPRAFELAEHPFFVATLFQPELAALDGRAPPIVRAFLEAAARN